MIVLFMSVLLGLVGCGDDHTAPTSETTNTENNLENESSGDEMSNQENEDLTLQVVKADEDEGITLDNSDFYQALSEVIAEDPQMGDANDLSLYPYSVIEKEDGGNAALFLVINRLGKPIENLIFDLTLGNQNDEYVYENMEVDLPGEVIGVLDHNGVIPILLDIEEQDIDLFLTLEQDNIHLQLDNVGIDFKE